ncbi:class I SAM-dependent methyltransferase [Mesorhizobium sp. M2C.T.Ca.TU.002.02.1.1]|uniref:class I SAM-dependent methyltransferase n=1 Tax=Mesorhizobium sp. M2C.T.Ca.TU.002.02.1.1 TaxID=2496788 RepID=UPI001FE00985|nr:class I SAM-dependent methyltransferase [Mesorhizobium sp. M2C.T.Ca.TU.002.02.1.1]
MKKSFDDLYKAFEDRFRGSREHVKERLQIYQPLLAQVPRKAEGPTLAIDLGCGRGEWLEVLAEAGLEATGVDTNARMAQEATDNGLKIELQDALEHLVGRPDDSVAVISAFHMVEHVPTDYLIGLLDECRRVLTRDGLLILETPNPENVSVGTHTFHLDPTHRSPLPPTLLEFLVEQAGFEETAIVRLNGAPMIEAGPIERSVHLMFEVARDYACLARKRAKEGPEALAGFVQSTSQQHPADTGRIRQWLGSADDEIAGLSAARAELTSHTDQLHQRIASFTDQAQSMQNEIDGFRDAIASLAHHTGSLEPEVASLAHRTGNLEAEVASLAHRKGILEAEITLAHQKLSAFESTIVQKVIRRVSGLISKLSK